MLVTDAGVLIVALADDGPAGAVARARLRGEGLFAPELVDLEVTSVLRRLVRSGHVLPRRAQRALDDLIDLPLERVSHRRLLPRCWELRDGLTTYDAAYVALAELLGTTLVTGDRRLAGASSPRCPIEVLAVST